MISASATASIEWLFEKALRDNSILGPEDACVVRIKADMPPPVESATRRLVVLNIASYVFRIVALFDFDTNAATLAHLARIMRRGDEILDGRALLDAFGEFVNRVCGEVNRGLSANFRHAGMSTPFILEHTCLGYLSILKPSHVSSFEVTVNDAARFDVIVCICVDSETSLDFHVDRSAQEDAASGELELF
jgi:hypothetical protein